MITRLAGSGSWLKAMTDQVRLQNQSFAVFSVFNVRLLWCSSYTLSVADDTLGNRANDCAIDRAESAAFETICVRQGSCSLRILDTFAAHKDSLKG